MTTLATEAARQGTTPPGVDTTYDEYVAKADEKVRAMIRRVDGLIGFWGHRLSAEMIAHMCTVTNVDPNAADVLTQIRSRVGRQDVFGLLTLLEILATDHILLVPDYLTN